MALYYFLQVSLKCVVTEDCWTLITTSAFSLLCFEVYEGNLASYRYLIRKGRSILIAFPDTWWLVS